MTCVEDHAGSAHRWARVSSVMGQQRARIHAERECVARDMGCTPPRAPAAAEGSGSEEIQIRPKAVGVRQMRFDGGMGGFPDRQGSDEHRTAG